MARWFFLLTVVALLVVMVGCGKQPAKTADELGIAGLNQFQLADAILAEEIRIADLAVANRGAARKAAAALAEKVAFVDKSSAWYGSIIANLMFEQRVLKWPWWQRMQRKNWTRQWMRVRSQLEYSRRKLDPPGHDHSIAELDAEFHKRIPDMFRVVTDYPLVYLRAAEAEKLLKRAEAIHVETDDKFVLWIAEGVVRRAKINIELTWKVRLAPTFQIVSGDQEKEEREKEELRCWRELALWYWKVNYERRLAPDATATSK